MITKKDLIIAVLLTFCISVTLFRVLPISSQSGGDYDPWYDINDDGDINMVDVAGVAKKFGTSGTPINKTTLLLELQSRVDSLNASYLELLARVKTLEACVCAVGILNGCFEGDPTGTSFNDISDWNHSVYEPYGGAHVENLEIVDDYCFNGNKSLYSYIQSNTGGDLKNYVDSYFRTENPVSTCCDYMTLWVNGDGYTTSSRYSWRIELRLTDGTNTHYDILICHCWGNNEGCNPNHYDYYNATAAGADGNTWKRYTRRIPDNMDKSNLTITILHAQYSWDYTSASSWYRVDSIYFSDSEGNPAT